MNLTNSIIKNLPIPPTERDYTDSKTTGLKVRVTKTGNKTFYLYYKIDGKRFKYRIGKFGDIGLPKARDVVENLQAKISLNINPAEQRNDKRKANLKLLTLKQFLDTHYYPYAEQHQKDSHGSKRMIERCFKSLMNKKLPDINTQHIDSFRVGELKRNLNPVTINHSVGTLRNVLNHAVKWKYLTDNPLNSYKPLKTDNTKVIRWLSTDEENRLYTVINARSDHMKCIITLLDYP